ncbi:NUDIX hydrolase [Nocardiopsis suaedae]|uniref:NUDIX domain-containing protein n=1 Tax=Nocardiopsis suaedae TaxID=3018444 RepID=A0ABT4TTC0_9ACTN|nr:NUDIX domain-containing protein [Nocardiopsis suaedae]MDA2807945.1 NUDIX domain-containing protein [Nocardiopsis suaedae]
MCEKSGTGGDTDGASEGAQAGREGTSFRLAAYALCIDGGKVLLTRHVSGNWTLPGGRVEHGEDPFDAVTREVEEETGYGAQVERLLGVDSRVIPPAVARAGVAHQNVGVFYRVRVGGDGQRSGTGSGPSPVEDADTVETAWTPFTDVPSLPRSSLVDVGIELVRTLPASGHVPPVPVGGLVDH